MISCGIDLIEIERLAQVVQRHGMRFLSRVYTDRELAEVGQNMASLAARFAAKEAVSKALGTGIGRMSWQDVEVLRGPNGEPRLFLHGAAASLAQEKGLTDWSISLSHAQLVAAAMVVATDQ